MGKKKLRIHEFLAQKRTLLESPAEVSERKEIRGPVALRDPVINSRARADLSINARKGRKSGVDPR